MIWNINSRKYEVFAGGTSTYIVLRGNKDSIIRKLCDIDYCIKVGISSKHFFKKITLIEII